jgi:uncharacterized coiled-coil protein SlyX
VADQTRPARLAALRRAVQDKESELSDLDLMLADYQAEHSGLIRELRRLRARLRDAEEAALPPRAASPNDERPGSEASADRA